MKSRIFVLMSTITVFAVLGIRIRVAAQVEQEQPNNQTNYFVKDLDTLEDTSAVAKCITNASLVFADTRPPQAFIGACAVSPATGRLNGECFTQAFGCHMLVDPRQCPLGALPKQRGNKICDGHYFPVDYSRPCS